MKCLLRLACTLPLLAGLCAAGTLHREDGAADAARRVRQSAVWLRYVSETGEHTVSKSSANCKEQSPGLGISVGTSSSGWIAPSNASSPTQRVGGTPQNPSHSDVAASLANKPAAKNHAYPGLSSRVILRSGVSKRALYEIESEGKPDQTAAAYMIASRYAYQHGDGAAARLYMKRCLRLVPEQADILEWNAFLLIDGGNYDAAAQQAKQATRMDPKSAWAHRLLGLAYYHSARFGDAIASLERAQQMEPSEVIARYLARARRERGVESKFNRRDSSHFVLRYEGKRTGLGFAPELLYTLDQQYVQLQNELGFSPGITITVIVYTGRQFFDVTRAPGWAGGLNDGKIHIPVRNLNSVTPELQAVLRHEMAHSFIHAYTHGRCPTWLNEGIAQIVEPRSSDPYAAPLARLFREGGAVPLRALEASFLGLNSQQATIAYAESLAAVEYLRSAKGVYGLRRILDALNDGDEPEAALQRAVQLSYKELESGTAGYLAANTR